MVANMVIKFVQNGDGVRVVFKDGDTGNIFLTMTPKQLIKLGSRDTTMIAVMEYIRHYCKTKGDPPLQSPLRNFVSECQVVAVAIQTSKVSHKHRCRRKYMAHMSEERPRKRMKII